VPLIDLGQKCENEMSCDEHADRILESVNNANNSKT